MTTPVHEGIKMIDAALLVLQLLVPMFLMMLYCFSMGERADVAHWMTGVPEDRVLQYYAAFRDIYAWFQVHLGKGVTFNQAEVQERWPAMLFQSHSFLDDILFHPCRGILQQVGV